VAPAGSNAYAPLEKVLARTIALWQKALGKPANILMPTRIMIVEKRRRTVPRVAPTTGNAKR
jgi:hypothetical protein